MDRCKADIFSNGHSVATLDACMHRAETFVQAVAKASGQRVDWHYSGGIANVLYIGDHAKVAEAIDHLAPMLTEPVVRRSGECGSCPDPHTHRPASIMRRYAPEAHGPYRAGDELPPGVVAVDTVNDIVFVDPRHGKD